MPDIVDVRVHGNRPGQDGRVEAPLVDEVVDKGGPLQNPDLHLNAHLCQTLLDDLRAFRPDLVSLVGDDFKDEGFAVLVERPVPVGVFPAGFRQERPGLCGIVGVALHVRIVRPCAGLVGSGGFLSQSQQDPVDDLLLVDGMGNGLPDPLVGKHGFGEIVPEEGVGKREVAVLVVASPEQVIFRLPGVLKRRQVHAVHAVGPQFQEHGGHVGNHPHDVAVQVGPPLEIIRIRRQHDLLTGHPLPEAIGTRPDRVSPQGRPGDVLTFQKVSGKDGGPPAHQGGREGLGIGHPEGMGIQDLRFFHFQKIAGIRGGRLGIDRHPVGVQDIVSREGAAVMPFDSLAKMEGDDQAVLGNIPGFGQIPDDLDVLVVLDQTVEHHAGNLVGCVVGSQDGDQVAGVSDGAFHQDVPIRGTAVRAARAGPASGAVGRVRAGPEDQDRQQDRRQAAAGPFDPADIFPGKGRGE